MRFKGKDINSLITLVGYVFPGDRKHYNSGKNSILLYKKKIDRFMVRCQFTIPPSKCIEQANYYILTK